jgi:hypothetical protein
MPKLTKKNLKEKLEINATHPSPPRILSGSHTDAPIHPLAHSRPPSLPLREREEEEEEEEEGEGGIPCYNQTIIHKKNDETHV